MFERVYIDADEEAWESISEQLVLRNISDFYDSPETMLDWMKSNPMSAIRTAWAYFRWNPDRGS